ncbi:uncharacterized protein LOC132034816 [Lycium ferocissimum]|uniref:uncharacterized protein LOC132034816 n=1 Tax=Lycium ferocissimum TaxID=112874 RepID=UPI0028168790|nr:uncharacterized protein LOC132034816 [Lycium ferocissimum]
MDWDEAGKLQPFQMNKMDEFRYHAHESAALYKEKMKHYHDVKLLKRDFQPGDSVLLFNSRLKLFPSKLKSKWSGPFTLVSISPNGSMELKSDNRTRTFMVNGHRVKHYHWMVDGDKIVNAHQLKHGTGP